MTTPAHYGWLVLNARLREWYPEHEPREKDPTYHLFHAAKRKMKKLDLPCWRCGVHYADLVQKGDQATARNPLAAYQLEAHHADAEFSILNAIDVAKWWEDATGSNPDFLVPAFSNLDGWLKEHPQYAGKPHDEVFLAYMESDGNLLQLCDACHRSKDNGVHHIPYPDWRARKLWIAGLPAHIGA